jgi:hypothetical protein
MVCDAAKSSVKPAPFLGVLGRLYSLFAAPVNRRDILTDHTKSFILKQFRDTRWEAKLASVEALRYQIVDFNGAFITLADRQERHDPEVAHEAVTLFQHLKDLSF